MVCFLNIFKQKYIKVNPKSVEQLIDIFSSLHDTENHFEFSSQFAKRRIHRHMHMKNEAIYILFS